MDCTDYLELLSAQLDGELTDREEQALSAHLETCPACRELARQLAGLHQDFSQLEELQAPEQFVQDVMKKVGGERKVLPLFKRPQWKAAAGLAACAVLCVGLLYGVQSQGRPAAQDSATASAGGAEAMAPYALDDWDGLGEEEKKALCTGADIELESQSDADEGEYGVLTQQMERSAPCYELRGQMVGSILTLPALPDGWEEVLGEELQWLTDESYGTFCLITGEQMEGLMALAQAQWPDLQEMAANRIGQEELCALVLSGTPAY